MIVKIPTSFEIYRLCRIPFAKFFLNDYFYQIRLMKSIVYKPKSNIEFKFLTNLLDKLGINFSPLSEQELEDIGLSKLMQDIDKTKEVSRVEIMKKLNSTLNS